MLDTLKKGVGNLMGVGQHLASAGASLVGAAANGNATSPFENLHAAVDT